MIVELLRRTADHILVEMVQLLFTRLPEFKEDSKWKNNMKKVNPTGAGTGNRKLTQSCWGLHRFLGLHAGV